MARLKNLVDLNKVYGEIIHQAALEHDVPEHVLAGLIWQESRGDSRALSLSGAMGLCQLMPLTAKEIGVHNPYDPVQSINGGAKYLKWILKNFTGRDMIRLLAAYNAGVGRLKNDRWKKFKETRIYVEKVMEYSRAYAMIIYPNMAAMLASEEKKSLFTKLFGWMKNAELSV